MALQSNDDFQLFLVGFLGRIDDFIETVSVNTDGFLHENVFSLGHSIFKMHGAKAGRGGDTNKINLIDHGLVGIKAYELPALRDINLGRLAHLLELFLDRWQTGTAETGSVDLIGESFSHSGEAGTVVGVEALDNGAAVAAAHADHANLNFVTPGHLGGELDWECGGSGDRGAAGEEFAARGTTFFGFLGLFRHRENKFREERGDNLAWWRDSRLSWLKFGWSLPNPNGFGQVFFRT